MVNEEVEQMLRGKDPHEGPPINARKIANGLTEAMTKYNEPTSFKHGDILRQRKGLMLTPQASHPVPYIFDRYLADDQVKEVFFPAYHRMDCVIGQSDQDGDMQFCLADSHRLEAYPQADMDEVSARAARAIN